MGIPRAKTEPLFRTAVEEARFRLDIVHRLLGTGDDLPDWFFGPLTTYRLLLEDFLEDPGGLVYLGIVIAVLSASTTKFETLVLAGMIQVYAAVVPAENSV